MTTRGTSGRRHESDRASAAFARAGSGSIDDFARFYDLVIGRVFGAVLAIVGHVATAETVTFEVMVELWRVSPRWNPDLGSAVNFAVALAEGEAIGRSGGELPDRSETPGGAATP